MLLDAEQRHGITAVSYDDDVHPYSDLLLGRVDAVLLDNVLADRAMRRTHGPRHPASIGRAPGTTSIILAPGADGASRRVNGILRDAMRDGRLEAIFRKWKVWNDDQPQLYARLTGRGRPAAQRRRPSTAAAARRSAEMTLQLPAVAAVGGVA